VGRYNEDGLGIGKWDYFFNLVGLGYNYFVVRRVVEV
jgi:hypothetical protein